jgi:hypothetical protein
MNKIHVERSTLNGKGIDLIMELRRGSAYNR